MLYRGRLNNRQGTVQSMMMPQNPPHAIARPIPAALRCSIACVLWSAAALKGYDLWNGGGSQLLLGVPRWLIALEIEVEAILGLLLVVWRHPFLPWFGCLCFFCVATWISFLLGIDGQRSCCCFGSVPVNPWCVFGIDLLVFGALLRWCPSGLGSVPARQFAPLRVLGTVAQRKKHAVTIVLCPIALLTGMRLLGIDSSPLLFVKGGESQSALGLRVRSPVVDLGRVLPGSTQEARFEIVNESGRPVQIDRIETSCKCLTIRVPDGEIPPARTVVATATFDPRNEPDFRGRLAIRVAGVLPSGATGFRTVVQVEVAD